MTNTVTISIDTANHAIRCIHVRAAEGLSLLEDAPKNPDPHQAECITEARVIIAELYQAEMELLTAIDQAKGAEQ